MMCREANDHGNFERDVEEGKLLEELLEEATVDKPREGDDDHEEQHDSRSDNTHGVLKKKTKLSLNFG